MPKRYNVSPQLREGSKSYVAVFRTATGKRVCRGLRTRDVDHARLICAGLVRLWNSGTKTIRAVPVEVPTEAVDLYFQRQKHESAEGVRYNLKEKLENESEFEKLPARYRTPQLLALQMDRERLRRENVKLRGDNAVLQRDLARAEQELAGLRRSVLAKAAEASKKVPPLKESLALFEKHLAGRSERHAATRTMSYVRRFVGLLPKRVRSLPDITPDILSKIIDDKCQEGDPKHTRTRRYEWRTRVGVFINWGAQTWGYPSIMSAVRGVSPNQLSRERGDIRWHTQEEIEAALANLPSPYWQGLVATLAYAGLQLAELCWVRTGDVVIKGKGGTIWVGTVEDGDARHLLKTSHRQRHVNIHPRLLLPRLQQYIKAGGPGSQYFFPMLRARAPKACDLEGPPTERWIPHSLSRALRGRKRGERQPLRRGLLPKGMTPSSLRRTFGSLLLRSGKTAAQVAAAMGNTETVVREHYARILGNEVKIDF